MHRSRKNNRMGQRSRQGFALPTVLGVGLVLLLISMTIILRTLSDRQISNVQGLTYQSLVTAETGLARVQDLLLKYPGLAAQDGVKSWSTAIAIQPPAPSCGTKSSASVITLSPEDERLINSIRKQDWILVDSENPSQGQFQISSYQVGATQSQLAVKGQFGLPGRASNTAVEVQMPLELTSPVAGIWVTADKTNPVPIVVEQDQTLAANVFFEDLSGKFDLKGFVSPTTISCKKFIDGTCKTYQFLKSTAAKPDPPEIPKDSLATSQGATLLSSFTSNNPNLILPRPKDKADSDNNYRYLIPQLFSLIKDQKITIKPPGNQKVIFYLANNLSITENAQLNSDGNAENFEIYGSSSQQPYGTQSKAQTGLLNLNSTQPINAFIYAPDAKATFQGPSASLTGGLWVKQLSTLQTRARTEVISQSNCLKNLQVETPKPTDIKTAKIRPTQTWQRKPVRPSVEANGSSPPSEILIDQQKIKSTN